MNQIISRLLLGLAAAIYGFGSLMHAIAFFGMANQRLGSSNFAAFFENELRVLWLADSSTLLGLAIVFGFLAARPASASRPMIVVLSLIPAGTTALLYVFLGTFYAAHLLCIATLMVIAAALIRPVPLDVPQRGNPGLFAERAR